MARKTTIHDVIEDFPTAASNAQRGEKFERLVGDYFLDPILPAQYSEPHRWPE